MEIRYHTQPENGLGLIVESLIESDPLPIRVTIASAFVSLRTILRLEERLLQINANGRIKLVFGVDLGGTSREVLERIMTWSCEAFIIHHPIPRHTFHPKVFLFEFGDKAHLIVGSNNLTDGGLYSNFEAFTHTLFDLPSDQTHYESASAGLGAFLVPNSPSALPLTTELIQALADRGELPTEREARNNRSRSRTPNRSPAVESPFLSVGIPLAPTLSPEARRLLEEIVPDLSGDEDLSRSEEQGNETARPGANANEEINRDPAALVWQKRLSNSDALNVREGTNPVGGVRLTQGEFRGRIDQTTYFRELFSDYEWGADRRRRNSESATIQFRLIINDHDYGAQSFEISHKPSGEASQGNYTTELHWGVDFSSVIREQSISGFMLNMYRDTNRNPEFSIIIEPSVES